MDRKQSQEHVREAGVRRMRVGNMAFSPCLVMEFLNELQRVTSSSGPQISHLWNEGIILEDCFSKSVSWDPDPLRCFSEKGKGWSLWSGALGNAICHMPFWILITQTAHGSFEESYRGKSPILCRIHLSYLATILDFHITLINASTPKDTHCLTQAQVPHLFISQLQYLVT